MTKYETYENSVGTQFIRRLNEDGTESHFSTDPANSDYQRYLRWLENPESSEV